MLTITRNIGLVSFSGNPIVLVVTTNNHIDNGEPRPFYSIFCRVFLEDPALNGEPYYTDSMQPDADGVVRFDLKSILRPKTKPTLIYPITESTKEIKDANAILPFWLVISEGYGIPFIEQEPEITTDPYYAIPGGLCDSVLADIERNESNIYAFLEENKIFFTSQPERKRVFRNQIEMLRYFNFAESTVTTKLMLRQYTLANNVSQSEVYECQLDALSLYDLNVSPSLALNLNSETAWWEIFLADSATEEPISEVASFTWSEFLPTNPRQIFIQNSLGGFDSVVSIGSRSIINEGEPVSGFVARHGSTTNWLEPFEIRRESKQVYKGVLGYYNSDELNWLREFFLSESRYLVQNGRLEKMVLRQSEFAGDSDSLPGTIEIEAELGAPNTFFFRRKRKLTFPRVNPDLALRLLTEDNEPILTENSKYILVEI